MTTCIKCHAEFEPQPWQVRKSDYKCRPCSLLREQAYRAKRKAAGNPVKTGRISRERQSAQNKAWHSIPGNRAKSAANQRRYRKDPEKRQRHHARQVVRRDVEAGRLTRQPCEKCGAVPADKHHDDYAKPREVRWLCRAHHAEHHHARATGGN